MTDKRAMVEWLDKHYKQSGASNLVKQWAWQGYRGYSFGSVQWGERLDGTILRVSGSMADKWLTSGKPTGHNCSRFDISLTIWGCLQIDADIARHKEQAIAYRNRLHSRPYAVSHIQTSGAGDTLYLGSRASEQYVRIYNKQEEQRSDENYATAIRYECEYKDKAANQVLERCRSRGYTRNVFAEYLVGSLSRRGVPSPVDFGVDGSFVAPVDSSRGDIEASLSWLETQVAPTVRRLVDAGRYDDIIKALGLDKRKEARNGEDTNGD